MSSGTDDHALALIDALFKIHSFVYLKEVLSMGVKEIKFEVVFEQGYSKMNANVLINLHFRT